VLYLNLWIPAVLLFLFAACGDDGGDEDSLFTGLSGVIIVALVIWFVVRRRNRR
jgi:LPXTG-motif cell wall-anchored protein